MKHLTIFLTLGFLYCFAGGYIEKGGYIDGIQLFPTATNFNYKDYYVICLDSKENKEGNYEEDITKYIEYIPSSEYKGGCEQIGEVSEYYLFHLFPASGKLDPEYAMVIPVQKLEGDTMINLRSWHETHYYSILGKVRVLKIKGDVIKFSLPAKTNEKK
ncbi:MAG: hypothetical protein ACK4UJ_05590 [Leptonema sp. (in: bacteria)]